eukprot:276145_1
MAPQTVRQSALDFDHMITIIKFKFTPLSFWRKHMHTIFSQLEVLIGDAIPRNSRIVFIYPKIQRDQSRDRLPFQSLSIIPILNHPFDPTNHLSFSHSLLPQGYALHFVHIQDRKWAMMTISSEL